MRAFVTPRSRSVDASGIPLLQPDTVGEERLRRLRLVSLVVPAAFLLLVLCFRGLIVGAFSLEHGHLLLDGILVLGTLVFSLVMFSLIDRSYRAVLQENRDLAAVDAVAVAARGAYTVEAVAQAALAATLEATGARGGRIVAAHPSGPHQAPDVWSLGVDPCEMAAEASHGSAQSVPSEERVTLMSGPEAIGSLTVVDLPADSPLSPAALTGIGSAVGSALQRARYMAVLQQENHDATRAERDRVAREMHDGLAQALGAAHFRLAAIGSHPDVTVSDEVQRELADIARTCQDAYTDVREAILGLRESGRAEAGLPQSLETFVEKFTRSSGIPTTLQTDLGGPALPPHHATQVLRVVQEALTNVRKHSGATRACVRVETEPDSVLVMIEDDGRGFDPSAVDGDRYGLATMSERTQLLDGWLTVDSSPGHGTRITLGVPCPANPTAPAPDHAPSRPTSPHQRRPYDRRTSRTP